LKNVGWKWKVAMTANVLQIGEGGAFYH